MIGVGGLVLAGWALGITALKSPLPGLGNMKSNTALLLILAGCGLLMYMQDRHMIWQQAVSLFITLTGLLTFLEYAFDLEFGIDQILFPDNTLYVLHPGRMSPSTAIVFLLLGVALWLLDQQRWNGLVEPLVEIAFAICGLALIGYLYGVSALYQIGAYASMAPHTAVCLLLFSLAMLFARPDQGLMRTILDDTLGGEILRRFLPWVLLAPILLGWIRLQGQLAGWYDTAFGLALMVISLITTLTIFIIFNARQLTRIDKKRRQVDQDLRESELRFRSTLESMMEGCQIISHDWRYLFLNDSVVAQSHLSREQLLDRTMMECYPGIENSAMFRKLQECMEQRTSRQMVNEFIYPHGEKGWFELSIQPAPDGIFILSTDITQHKRSEAALLEREKKLTTLFEILPVGISILDAERNVTYTNPALKRILDISDEGLQAGQYRNRTYLKGNGERMEADEMASTRAFQEAQEIDGLETGVVKENGAIIWTEVSAVPVDFADWRLVLMTRDITDHRQAEKEILQLNADLENRVADRTAELARVNEHLQQLSLYDELTGLYNRRGFLLLAEEQLALARHARWNVLVFYGDLDGLKPINDELGHGAGDQALVTAAQALKQTFRASDIKARLGGDEFIVLAFQLEEETGRKILARLHENLTRHHQSMSMGMVALNETNDITLHELMTRADEAMYVEKRHRSRRGDG